MEEIANVIPGIITAIVTAIIGILVLRRRDESEIRLIDAQTLNEINEFKRDTTEQILRLNNAVIEEQLKRRELEVEMERMKTEYERRIEMYKTQIRNLEKRIRELENGKGQKINGPQSV